MARIPLSCECGWNFFVPGSAQGHETACPNCGNAVGIPGRRAVPGGPKAPGLLAAELLAKRKLVVRMIFLAAGAALLSALFLMTGGRRPAPTAQARPFVPPPPPVSPPRPEKARVEEEQPASPRPDSSAVIEDCRKEFAELIRLLNLAGVVVKSLELRGHVEEAHAQQGRMRTWDARIAEIVAQRKLAAKNDYFLPGDRLIVFEGQDLRKLEDARADQDHLSPWLRAFRAHQAPVQVVVRRGLQDLTLYLSFDDVSPELKELAQLPEAKGPGRYVSRPASAEAVGSALPFAFLRDLEARFQAIPPDYRLFLSPFEAQRINQAVQSKMGTAEDLDFLQRILHETLPVFEREAGSIKTRIKDLEEKLREPLARDVVLTKSGGRLEGTVLARPGGGCRVKLATGEASLRDEDILGIERGKGSGAVFAATFKAGSKALSELQGLLTWCQAPERRIHLKAEAEYVALLIVAQAPAHDVARKAALLTPRPELRPSRP